MSEKQDDWTQIVDVLNEYATALDKKDWARLDHVFAEDATMDYGAWDVTGRVEVVNNIRRYLDGCGPTQHLLGNYEIRIDGDRATARVYVRAYHLGLGDRSDVSYEMFGEYRDELARTPEGWRITRRLGRPSFHLGDMSILGPG